MFTGQLRSPKKICNTIIRIRKSRFISEVGGEIGNKAVTVMWKKTFCGISELIKTMKLVNYWNKIQTHTVILKELMTSWTTVMRLNLHCTTVPLPRGIFVGHSNPQARLQAAPPNWNITQSKSVVFLSNSNVKPSLHEREDPLFTTFWRRFCCTNFH